MKKRNSNSSERCESETPEPYDVEVEDAQNGDIPLHIIENKGNSIPHSRWSY